SRWERGGQRGRHGRSARLFRGSHGWSRRQGGSSIGESLLVALERQRPAAHSDGGKVAQIAEKLHCHGLAFRKVRGFHRFAEFFVEFPIKACALLLLQSGNGFLGAPCEAQLRGTAKVSVRAGEWPSGQRLFLRVLRILWLLFVAPALGAQRQGGFK